MRHASLLYLIPVLCLFILACNRQPPPPQMQIPEVSVMKPLRQEVTNYLYFNGITRGVKQTEVRPRVAGYLERILFKADTQVKAGELLFVIDQRPYAVEVERTQAELAGKKATVQSTLANLDRVKRLVAQQAASEQELIDRQAAYDLAVAEQAVAEARLNEAKLNLDFTEVRAPIAGRVSRNLVDEGTLLRVNEPVLATIVNDESMYVDFQVSEAEFLDYLRKNPHVRADSAKKDPPLIVVELGMSDETGFPHIGKVVAGDNTVDPATATYGVRAEFPNPDKQIAAGLYVRVRTTSDRSEAMLIPDVAVQADERGEFVYVVGKDPKDGHAIAVRRGIETGPLAGAYRRIKTGLEADDEVIFNGVIRLRPEAPIQPTNATPPPAPPTTLPATVPATTALPEVAH
jgi:multidrug efflux system membrane fusion protein